MKGLTFASHEALRGRSLLSLGSAQSTRKRRVESARPGPCGQRRSCLPVSAARAPLLIVKGAEAEQGV